MSETPDPYKTRSTLLSKVQRGDEDGWTEFYRFYEDFFYSAARGAGLTREESQDVVQEAMITVRDYQAYQLFSVEDLSARTVADSLGISAVAVRVRAYRVRAAVNREIRRITKKLEETGLSAAITTESRR